MQTTLQFKTLQELAGFVEASQLVNYEVNRNALQLSCEIELEVLEQAVHQFGASVSLPTINV